MKRMPFVVTVLAVALLSASLAYWVLQLNQPPQRAIAAPPPPAVAALNLDAAKGLFGGQITVAAASNYQLKGVVAAGGSGAVEHGRQFAGDFTGAYHVHHGIWMYSDRGGSCVSGARGAC